MKLKSARITDFRSIRNSNKFDVTDVTGLVGKNESGKTAILQALYRLNPIVPEHGKFDVTDDYPRADVEDYQQGVENGHLEPAVAVEATYSLDPEEIKNIEKFFGAGVLKTGEFTLSKSYSNSRTPEILVDEVIAGEFLLAMAGISEDLRGKTWNSLSGLHELLTIVAEEKAKAFNEAQARVTAITDPDDRAKEAAQAQLLQESNASKLLRTQLAQIGQKGLGLHIWHQYIVDKLPVFLYFDEYFQMKGHLNIEGLRQRQAGNQLLDPDRPMLGLIELARLNLDQLVSPDRTESLISKLEGASNFLSKQVLRYWSQNRHLSVKFDVRPARSGDPEGMRTGTNLWGRVHDSVHLVSTPLGSRSKGFVWFFSFLAWFSQQKKLQKPMILLLDEPGLVLHGTAQMDLLRYIEEELKPHHQVIYTTHSPFMVDASRFDRIRIVEDRSMLAEEELPLEERGTKVYVDVLSVDEGSLFPLQGALGYEIAQTLFVGPNCLIVEGPSDLLYLQVLKASLEERRQITLSDDWTITPVGGSDKVPTFVALLGAQKGLRIATLIDIQNRDRQKIDNLYKSKLLKRKYVLTFADFTGKLEADIEDMFEPSFYLDLVNAEYSQVLKAPIQESDLDLQGRIVVAIEEHLAKHPLKKAEKFSHYRPARYFFENSVSLAPRISTDTLKRFEEAFTVLNSLL
jgi:energy-coupling factor transporter ATP-binding protein EcfA2